MFFFATWFEVALIAFIGLLFLPLYSSDRMRYYLCYIHYVFFISFFGFCLVPIFSLRPRNPVNLVIAGTLLKHMTRCLDLEWEVRGREVFSREDAKGSVLTFNHQSIFDILGMFNMWQIMGPSTVIAKQELLWVPPFGPVAWLAGLIYIDRKDPKSANKQILEASKELFKQKIHLCVFPEGTRNKKSENLLPFKNGAFRVALECQAPIIPIVFSPYYFIDSKNKLFSKGKVVISILDPIETKGMTLDDMESLKEKTYQIMSTEYLKLGEEVRSFKSVKH